MNFNRRGFLATLGTAFGAMAVPVTVSAAVANPLIGAKDQIWLCVSFEDGPDGDRGYKQALANLKARINEIGPGDYVFLQMELPRFVDYARNEMICGVPMRHIRVWDNISGEILNRLDVMAERKH